MISLLLLPCLACLLLVLIHVYFGAFVLRRGIIFIDLALAQWAALGYLVGHWLDIEHPIYLVLMGFGFTVVAALILTALKPLYHKVALQEAMIGVTYIGATTIATCLISTTGMEGHHLKDMLAGHLLFIQPIDLIIACTLYAGIGVLLWRCHHHFLSSQSQRWDFVFYVLFGCVVTSSVKMVGILLVFSYLVLPLLSVILMTQHLNQQIRYGWLIGAVASLVGLGLSIRLDIPPSYCIILVLFSIWLISATTSLITTKRT